MEIESRVLNLRFIEFSWYTQRRTDGGERRGTGEERRQQERRGEERKDRVTCI